LRDYEALPKAIKGFIKGCKRAGLKWGGDFPNKDSVHFDDDLYFADRALYEELYRLYQ
jgi:hypothetical protein